jgi:hypothetical protein
MRSLEELLDGILSATEDATLKWQEARTDNYWADVVNHKLSIWEWSDPQSESTGITIELSAKDGKTLDTVQADEFSNKFPGLRELFNAARRSALNVSEVIEELANELKASKAKSKK